MCGQRVLNLFHLTLMMDVSLAVALPSLTVSPPSVPSSASSPAPPPLLPGSGLISQRQRAHTHTAGPCHAPPLGPRSVMAMVAKRASGHTHGAHHTLPESSQTLSIHHSPHYHTSCTPMGGLCGDVASPRSTIQVLWNSFRCDDTGMIPFPSSPKNTAG